MKSYTVKEIADKIGGTVSGNGDMQITHPASADTTDEASISFIESKKLLEKVQPQLKGAVIIPRSLSIEGVTAIAVDEPRYAFAQLLLLFKPEHPLQKGIHSSAVIADSAKVSDSATIMANVYVGENVTLGKNVIVYPNVYIGPGVVIGDNTILHPGVVIYEDCILGNRCIIKANSVIGGEGFGYFVYNGNQEHMPQIGRVILEDDVHIGSCTSVDRATIGDTVIHADVKADNLVQIAHNCDIGEHTVIAGQSGISGSVTIGKNCVIAGGVGIADHAILEDEVVVLARSGVEPITLSKGRYFGYPAKPAMQSARIYAALNQLPELLKDVRNLKKNLES